MKKLVLNEAKILSEVIHPRIIKYDNWYETRNHFWVIYEFLQGNTLAQIIKDD